MPHDLGSEESIYLVSQHLTLIDLNDSIFNLMYTYWFWVIWRHTEELKYSDIYKES